MAKKSPQGWSKGICRIDMKDDSLDDLAISGDMIAGLRMERMSADHIWGRVDLVDGRSFVLSFGPEPKKRVSCYVHEDS